MAEKDSIYPIPTKDLQKDIYKSILLTAITLLLVIIISYLLKPLI